jgi:hypothetical protein
MKLLRYGTSGNERPGILDSTGSIRDLSGVVSDIAGFTRINPQPQHKRPSFGPSGCAPWPLRE